MEKNYEDGGQGVKGGEWVSSGKNELPKCIGKRGTWEARKRLLDRQKTTRTSSKKAPGGRSTTDGDEGGNQTP